MQRLQAFKFELMPDGEQQRAMRLFSGSCRFVYNKALAMQKENHEAGNKFIGYGSMAANLPIWKREVGQEWLKDAPSQALQHALKGLEKAYENFFAKRADFPRFKRKGSGDSFRYPEPKQIKLDQANSRILLPKLGWLRYRNSRGHISKDNRQTQAKFLCVDCGYENHADVVGAINVLERGYRLLACGERAQSGRLKKQEPTEANQAVFV